MQNKRNCSKMARCKAPSNEQPERTRGVREDCEFEGNEADGRFSTVPALVCGVILSAGESKRMGQPKALLKFQDGRTLLERQVDLLKKGGCTNVVVVVGADVQKIKTYFRDLKVTGTSGNHFRSEILKASSETRKMNKKSGGVARSYVDGFFVKSDEVAAEEAKLQPEVVSGSTLTWVENQNWPKGQFSSILAGVENAMTKKPDAVIILPVDTVGVSVLTLKTIIKKLSDDPNIRAAIPSFKDVCGHPIALSRKFCEALIEKYSGNFDARLDSMLNDMKDVVILPVEDKQVVSNINTIEDWEKEVSLRA